MTDLFATVAECLMTHGELHGDEIELLVDHWRPLDRRLHGYEPGDVRLDLYIKDRDKVGQHLTLEAQIVGLPALVATSSDQDFDHALNVVRDEMLRLITDAKDTHRRRDSTGFRSA